MTRNEKKQELIALFATGAMPIGELIDACFAFADNHPHWISVEDELPKGTDISAEVLIAACGDVWVGFYDYEGDQWYPAIKGITHWMPTPQPPKKGGLE